MPRWRAEQGNTFVLFPAAILVVLALGSLALDAATVFLGQRRLADLAAAVANDAVAGVSEESFYAGDSDQLRIDPARANLRAAQLVEAQPEDRALLAPSCLLTLVEGGQGVRVECTATVRPIIAPAIPGLNPVREVRAVETAVGLQR